MNKYCDNCGCKVFNGACVNCNEEVYIVEQYIELDMSVPDVLLEKIKSYEHEIRSRKK